MHCSSLTPVGIYEVWPYQRDHARGTTPLAQAYLDECRTYTAPSKAHKRRILLKRDRPIYTRSRPAPEPDQSERQQHNSLAQMGREVAAIAARAGCLERHYINTNKPIVPDTHKPLSPTASRTYHPAKNDAWPTQSELDERIARLAREHEQAVAATKRG